MSAILGTVTSLQQGAVGSTAVTVRDTADGGEVILNLGGVGADTITLAMTRAEYIKFAVEVLKSAPIIGMLDNAEFVKQMVKILPVLNQKAVNV